VKEVASLATVLDRFDVAMHAIGDVLGRVKARDGNSYPHPAIVTVLEESAGDQMLEAFRTSVFNVRGVTWRGHGGQQEYDLAKKYEAIGREIGELAPRTREMFDRLAQGYRVDGAHEDEREQRIEDGIDMW
jgi:hypothetical protein